jgi:hypothetical protein
LNWVFKLPADFRALKVPEEPGDTGALSFGSFLLAKKENEQ